MLFLLAYMTLSLSYALYTSECVCSTEEHTCVQMRNTPLFILFLTLDFFPNQVGPNKLTEPNSPRKTQNNIILYSGGFYWPNLQWMFYLMTLWWPNTIVTSRQRNKTYMIGVWDMFSKFSQTGLDLEVVLVLKYCEFKEYSKCILLL